MYIKVVLERVWQLIKHNLYKFSCQKGQIWPRILISASQHCWQTYFLLLKCCIFCKGADVDSDGAAIWAPRKDAQLHQRRRRN